MTLIKWVQESARFLSSAVRATVARVIEAFLAQASITKMIIVASAVAVVAFAVLVGVTAPVSDNAALTNTTTTNQIQTSSSPTSSAVTGLPIPVATSITTTPNSIAPPTSLTAVPTTASVSPVPQIVPSAQTSATLSALRISDSAAPSGYVRDLFPVWLDLDGNGCDAREDVLFAESLIPVARSGCKVLAGKWVSPYDGGETTEPGKLDIDHMVPLANAWRSGANTWDANRRAAYANDTSDPEHLIAVTASTNRSKSDSSPAEWRPPLPSDWCVYAQDWIDIKVKWSLTATTSERDALGQMLATCR